MVLNEKSSKVEFRLKEHTYNTTGGLVWVGTSFGPAGSKRGKIEIACKHGKIHEGYRGGTLIIRVSEASGLVENIVM